MAKYIPKDASVADIERRIRINKECMLGLKNLDYYQGKVDALNDTLSFIDTLEVKDVNSMMHKIIVECCDWLASHTRLSHTEIEGCRNLMLTVKEEQLKSRK